MPEGIQNSHPFVGLGIGEYSSLMMKIRPLIATTPIRIVRETKDAKLMMAYCAMLRRKAKGEKRINAPAKMMRRLVRKA